MGRPRFRAGQLGPDVHAQGSGAGGVRAPLGRPHLRQQGGRWSIRALCLGGDAEFFLLEDRCHRVPNLMREDSAKTMFGHDQMRWLKESLVSSRVQVKVVVNGNPVIVSHAFESFANCTNGSGESFDWMRAQGVEGVVPLSGDRRFTELSRLEGEGSYPLYDFTSSPLTATPATVIPEEPRASRVEGTMVKGKRNFGLLRCDGVRKNRHRTMEWYDAGGTLLWSQRAMGRDLRMPAPEEDH